MPLTVQEVWDSKEIMELNADLGLGIDDIMRFVRAVEATQSKKKQRALVPKKGA